MDAARFDALAKSLSVARSRRGALGGLLVGALSLLGVRSEKATAHDPLKACKKKSGDAKKKCIKKAKKHNAQHASETVLPPSPPPGPTCSDGIKNGTESDVDCGGTCPPCGTAKSCQGAGDCASRVCLSQVCRAPTCFDLVRNGSESDIDCGGGTCPRCANERTCASRNDCAGALCVSGTCKQCDIGGGNVCDSGCTCVSAAG